MKYQKIIKNVCIAGIAIGVLVGTFKTNVYASENTEVKVESYNWDIVESYSWDKEGIYPVFPGDGMWEQLSYTQQLEAISMPEEKLDDFTSEELAEWVLEYPFLVDVLAFDTAEQAIYYLTQTSNICNELFSREDAVDVLLEKYNDLSVDYEMLNENNVGSTLFDNGYAKELFLQTYFADNFEQLSESEKDELKQILEDKYINKIGICDDYSSALLFYAFLQAEYDVIPENIIPEVIADLELFETVAVDVEESADTTSTMASSGFTSSGGTTQFNSATYYVGTYTLYGVTVGCYKYKSGDYSDAEKSYHDSLIASAHSSWTKVYSATKKYNCHSYAWINASQSNVYWLDNPKNFANSSSFTYIGKNGSASSGDRIVITDTSGSLAHSMLACSNGTNSISITTTSKLGSEGVYDAPLVDMMILYSGSYYEVYR